MDDLWGQIKTALGKIDADVRIGGGVPPSASFSFGENRMMSATALVIALAVGLVLGVLLSRGR